MGGGADARGGGEQIPGHLWEPEEPPSWGPGTAVLSEGWEHTCPLRRGQRATAAHPNRGAELQAGGATLGLRQSPPDSLARQPVQAPSAGSGAGAEQRQSRQGAGTLSQRCAGTQAPPPGPRLTQSPPRETLHGHDTDTLVGLVILVTPLSLLSSLAQLLGGLVWGPAAPEEAFLQEFGPGRGQRQGWEEAEAQRRAKGQQSRFGVEPGQRRQGQGALGREGALELT